MPSKKHINGLPNNLTQQYFSTLFYYDVAYMADWIFDKALEKNYREVTIDILNKTVEPIDLQIEPITAYLDTSKWTIYNTLTSVGFEKNFIVGAKFIITISDQDIVQRTLTCVAHLIDKDGKVYMGKKYTEQSYPKPKILKSKIEDKVAKKSNRILKWNSLKTYIVFSFFVLLLLKCSYDIYDGNKMRNSLKHKPKTIINAIVIDETHYFNNSPISHEHSYKYKFNIDNIEYKGACDKASYQPGDSIKIEYVVENPKYNCPVGIY